MTAIHLNLVACVLSAFAVGYVTSPFWVVTNIIACLINVVIIAAALLIWS